MTESRKPSASNNWHLTNNIYLYIWVIMLFGHTVNGEKFVPFEAIVISKHRALRRHNFLLINYWITTQEIIDYYKCPAKRTNCHLSVKKAFLLSLNPHKSPSESYHYTVVKVKYFNLDPLTEEWPMFPCQHRVDRNWNSSVPTGGIRHVNRPRTAN